jgi:hypothetical protein
MYLFPFSTCFGHPCAHRQDKITVSMRHWYLSLCIGWRLVCWMDWIQPADQTPPIQSDKNQCRIDTLIFSWRWAHGCPKHAEKRNKYTKQNCAHSWNYFGEYTGIHGQRNIKLFHILRSLIAHPTITNLHLLPLHLLFLPVMATWWLSYSCRSSVPVWETRNIFCDF